MLILLSVELRSIIMHIHSKYLFLKACLCCTNSVIVQTMDPHVVDSLNWWHCVFLSAHYCIVFILSWPESSIEQRLSISPIIDVHVLWSWRMSPVRELLLTAASGPVSPVPASRSSPPPRSSPVLPASPLCHKLRCLRLISHGDPDRRRRRTNSSAPCDSHGRKRRLGEPPHQEL